jgi:ABC-type glycerol-3-phosphate transport system substrate-binding protein
MSKTAVVLLALVFFVAGIAFAGGAGEEGATAGRPSLELTKAYFFGEPTDNQEEKEAFEVFITDRYNIDFTVNAFPRPEYMTKYALAMTSGDIKGLGWIFGGPYMEDYYRDGATVDMLPYVEGNENYKRLPAMMQDTYMRDGELLAITTGWREGLGYVRSIRQDWLDNLGLEKPTTVDEFYEVIKAFTEDDPDGNGKDDTVGMTSSGVWMMADIFGSFGTPLNHVMDHAITPDPHDNFRYNDGMLKPGMKAALAWFRRAYENGYLDQEVFTNSSSDIRSRMYSGKYGSVYYNYSWALGRGLENQIHKVDPTAEVSGIIGLTSSYADKFVVPGGIGSGPNIWVLIGGTRNPGEQVNAFIDVFLGDDIGFWSGIFGVYGVHWQYGPDDEILRLAKEVVDGKPKYFSTPGISAQIAGTDRTYLARGYRLEGQTEEQYEDRMEYYETVNETFREGQRKQLLFGGYPHSWSEPNSEHYAQINADIGRIFDEMVAAAITGQMTVDEAIASYRRQMRNLGAQKVLDQANAAIGKTSSTKWRY